MRSLILAASLLAGPAAAMGIEIEVAGEAQGTIVIDLFEEVAPNHAERIATLAEEGAYNGVAFHRVIEGFMAQTGDVSCGVESASCPPGTGGSEMGNLDAEFSELEYKRGVVGMARSQNPDSANSQFFIMFEDGPFLNGQYTVVGEVTEGMEVVDAIKRGQGANGAVLGEPDRMQLVTATE